MPFYRSRTWIKTADREPPQHESVVGYEYTTGLAIYTFCEGQWHRSEGLARKPPQFWYPLPYKLPLPPASNTEKDLSTYGPPVSNAEKESC